MRDFTDEYKRWLEMADDDAVLAELERIKGDDAAIKDRFYCELSFGTAGLRGVLGAGTNRMNVYTVARATKGLVSAIGRGQTAVVAYDSRINSELFARLAARLLASGGIRTRIFPTLVPVPMLSFAVRQFGAAAGICITASHNPAEYNGYKVYGADGAQLSPDKAELVLQKMKQIDYFDCLDCGDFDQLVASGGIEIIGDDFQEKYLRRIEQELINPEACRETPISVVYTPLNGAGNLPCRRMLARMGVGELHVVPEQEQPDGNFPTCPYPNPEFREALEKALELSEKVRPDVLLATDPDCDRVGTAVMRGGAMELLSGNEIGVLLTDYILKAKSEKGELPKDPVVVSTIVSTPLTKKVAAKYGCVLKEVLTGFKFIGGALTSLADKGESERFILGFEESYGYLKGDYGRDKDGVMAVSLIAEMTAYYKKAGLTLADRMTELYEEFGYHCDRVRGFVFKGADGMEKMSAIMQKLRNSPPESVGGLRVLSVGDVLTGRWRSAATGEVTKIELPASNVLVFELENGARAIARPSGTEPKLKTYLTAVGGSREEAEKTCAAIEKEMFRLIEA